MKKLGWFAEKNTIVTLDEEKINNENYMIKCYSEVLDDFRKNEAKFGPFSYACFGIQETR
jgi:hypothetical protein